MINIKKIFLLKINFIVIFLGLGTACAPAPAIHKVIFEPVDPAEVAIGERLFLETRIAEFFLRHSGGDMNAELEQGDPVLAVTKTLAGELPGPFRGQAMNCAACHLVDQQLETEGGGMRSYDDFASRSPIPSREDGKTLTPRNSPPLVNSTLFRPGEFFLHFDGEFGTIEDLVLATLTGRNFGWLPTEKETAQSHIVELIKKDDGRGVLAQESEAVPYPMLLTGTDAKVPEELRLPEEFRVDIAAASDVQILGAVSKLIGAYVNSLLFLQDESGAFNGSPYDLFLRKNLLPLQPDPGESPLAYSRRLIALVRGLSIPVFVGPEDGSFKFHSQEFRFGPEELMGMKVFFAEPEHLPLTQAEVIAAGIGNCIACHAAPAFTDFAFHNTGVTQREYDIVHEKGDFSALFVPDYFERSADPAPYLPATFEHPERLGKFVSIPSPDDPQATDLGMWVVFGNNDVPLVQNSLLTTLCEAEGESGPACSIELMLPRAIGRFKTPGLRDLDHSDPYMHNGQFPEIEEVLAHYFDFSILARQGLMRNPPKEFEGMALKDEDLIAMLAFLKSLNEDYE